jgi:hypothetical protein
MPVAKCAALITLALLTVTTAANAQSSNRGGGFFDGGMTGFHYPSAYPSPANPRATQDTRTHSRTNLDRPHRRAPKKTWHQ